MNVPAWFWPAVFVCLLWGILLRQPTETITTMALPQFPCTPYCVPR